MVYTGDLKSLLITSVLVRLQPAAPRKSARESKLLRAPWPLSGFTGQLGHDGTS